MRLLRCSEAREMSSPKKRRRIYLATGKAATRERAPVANTVDAQVGSRRAKGLDTNRPGSSPFLDEISIGIEILLPPIDDGGYPW